MNLIQAILQPGQDRNTPLHVGEVMAIWTTYTSAMEARVTCLLMANHTSDPELLDLIEHFVADIEEPMAKKLYELMSNSGISQPQVDPDKPKTAAEQVPVGAKFLDSEIANVLVLKVEALLQLVHTGIAQSVRDDVGAMFLGFYTNLVAQGFQIKKLLARRGWLRQPPFFQPLAPVAPR